MVRYLVAAVVAFLLLLALLLLVRPMIYSVAPPRDDSVYAVVLYGHTGRIRTWRFDRDLWRWTR